MDCPPHSTMFVCLHQETPYGVAHLLALAPEADRKVR